MPFSSEQIHKLEAPLSPSRVKKRQGSGGNSFDHIEGWDAIRQANEVFGFDAWSRELIELREVWSGEKKTQRGDKPAVAYIARVRITVRIDGESVIREGVGFGNGDGFNLGDAHELAAKEAETDAMKRGLSTFGYGFGLALYDKTKAHVGDEEPREKASKRAPKAESDEERAERLKAFALKARDAIQKTKTIEELDDVCKRIKAAPAWKEMESGFFKPTADKIEEFEATHRAALSAQSDDDQTHAEGEAPKEEAPQVEAPKAEVPKAAPKKAAPKAAAVQTASTKYKVRAFDIPEDRTAEGWRAWTRQPMAAIKASSSREEALAQLAANKDALAASLKDTGKDVTPLIMAQIDKRFPANEVEEAQEQTAQAKAFPQVLLVDLPTPQTPTKWEDYARRILGVIKAHAETDTQVEEIITANESGLALASAALRNDVAEKLRGFAKAHFDTQAAAR